MADRIITAEAIISAKDNTGDVFTRIGAKLQNVGKGAKASVEIDKMAKSLETAEAKARALDKFMSSQSAFGTARGAFRAKQQELEQLARTIAQAEKPTQALQNRYRQLQQEVSKAAGAMERQKTAVLDAKRAVEGFAVPLNKIGAAQVQARREIDNTTAAIKRQVEVEHKQAEAQAATARMRESRAHAIGHHGFVRYAAGAAAAAVGVHSVMRVGEAGWEAGVERQHVLTGMRNAGIPQEEIERAQVLAERTSRNAPNMSVSQLLELHKEARSAVRHPEEVFELMPDLARAASVLKGMGAENANIADLVKGGESLGLMNDPKRFNSFLEGQVKAMQVMGKTITTEQIYEAAKYSKATGSTLSDEFLNLTMPSLIQEMHGSSAGDALSALSKRWRGGLAHQHLAVERLNQMGLLEDPSQIKRNKTGEIMGYMGKLKGDSLLVSDPGKWFTSFFKDGAAKLGAKSLEDINKLLAETLPGTAANLGRIFLQQEETLEQHRAGYGAALGLSAAVEKQREDWKAAVGSFKASLDDLGASVTGPVLPAASRGLSLLADGLRSLASVAKDHPNFAVPIAGVTGAAALAGAGYLSVQFMTAGTSLQTAAAMLQEAAVLQGASPRGAISGLAGAVTPTLAETVGGGAVGATAGLGMGLTIGGLAWLIKASNAAQQPGNGGAWAPATYATQNEDREALNDQQRRYDELNARITERAGAGRLGSSGLPDFDFELQRLKEERLDLANQIRVRQESIARASAPPFPIGAMPGDGSLPTMVGTGMPSRKGPETFALAPMGSIGIPGQTLPAMAQIPTLPGAGGPIDVTGKVESKVDAHVDVVTRFQLSVPPGFGATQTFQSTVSRVNTGTTMPQAGIAHPAGRGD